MAIIRWNPWSLSSLLDEDWEMPTLPGLSRLSQGLNLYETENAVVAEAALPGIPEDKVDVTVDNGVVRISGSSQSEQEDKSNRKYFMSSMAQSFNYSFKLPEGLIENGEPIAELDKGILHLSFKKAKKVAPKKVKVLPRAK